MFGKILVVCILLSQSIATTVHAQAVNTKTTQEEALANTVGKAKRLLANSHAEATRRVALLATIAGKMQRAKKEQAPTAVLIAIQQALAQEQEVYSKITELIWILEKFCQKPSLAGVEVVATQLKSMQSISSTYDSTLAALRAARSSITEEIATAIIAAYRMHIIELGEALELSPN